jgi:hypothetical protein
MEFFSIKKFILNLNKKSTTVAGRRITNIRTLPRLERYWQLAQTDNPQTKANNNESHFTIASFDNLLIDV